MGNTLLHPDGTFASGPEHEVKVRYVARPPAPWTWTIHIEGHPEPAYVSPDRHRSAEEAWEAGRSALARLVQR
jgi:hypothetical protein